MKYILSILFLSIAFVGKSQTDSTQLLLPFQMKAKFAAVMAPLYPQYEDRFLMDTLKKAVGAGTNGELTTVVNFKVGTYLKMVQIMVDKQVGGYYDFAVEFFSSPLVANGYTGLLPFLDYYATNGTAQQKGAAIWLRTRVVALIKTKADVLLEDQVNGAARVLKTVIYN